MAVIHGSPVQGHFHGGGATERAEKPAFTADSRSPVKRAGTRKRAGSAMLAMLASMLQSYVGVPDQTRPRAAAETTKTPNYRQRQHSSLFDQLRDGDHSNLPLPLPALHSFCATFAVTNYAGTVERHALAYSDVYILNHSREQVLVIARRLGELLNAHQLLATIQEPNRHNVHGVMGALRRNAMQELAKGSIGVPLAMLAGRLCERRPDARQITKAWFALDQGVHNAYREGLDPGEYLQAGLERLSPAAQRVLACVLAPRPPVQARDARIMLEAAIDDTPRDISDNDGWEGLNTYQVHDAVRSHILSRLEIHLAETTRKLENALRPDVRTGEVASLLWRDLRHALDTIGWVYLEDVAGNAVDEKAAIEAEAERRFASAVARMPPATAAACLERLDPTRLVAMHAYREKWDSELHERLADALDRACDARFRALAADVRSAHSDLETVLDQDRRIATAHALLMLSDALAACQAFSFATAARGGWREDPLVDASILKAAASLRMPGEPGAASGRSPLRPRDDAAILDLARCDDPQVARGLALDPIAVTEELRRRSAQLDAVVDARLEQLSDLLRGPAMAPRPFIALIASVAQAETARREWMAVFHDGAAGHAGQPLSSALSRELAMLVYRRDGALPVQWMESRRHIGGLLDALRQIRRAAGGAGVDANASYPGMCAPLDTAISVLAVLGGHFGIHPGQAPGAAVRLEGTDPYWNDGCLVDTAPFFGLRYEPATGRALPLCGAMHRARLLAAMGMRMAHPDQSDPQPVMVSVLEETRAAWIDRQFHEACRRGDISLSVAGPWAPAAIAARTASAGSELMRQSPPSLEHSFSTLADFGNDMDATLTRLMSTVAHGVADFVQGIRDMPDAGRWPGVPAPEAVRHIHFDLSELARGGYRLDVAACLETLRPGLEVHLAFALQVNETGGRVIRLIVPPEARLLPAAAAEPGNSFERPVTTAGIEKHLQAVAGGGALLAAAGG